MIKLKYTWIRMVFLMPKAYIYSSDDKLVIGNDFIERHFSVCDNHLHTEKIINKRIKGEKELCFGSFSSEFFIGIKNNRKIGEKTSFLSSNVLELDNINIFKQKVEFIFKPYPISGAYVSFILNIEIEDNKPYMKKYLEIIIEERYQKNLRIDYIDCEHICFEEAQGLWSAADMEKAYISGYHTALGQPVYINGFFFCSEFPLSDNRIENKTVRLRYFCGKCFDKLRLNLKTTFRTWPTIAGAARGIEYYTVQKDFYRYIDSLVGEKGLRFQYNSWFDRMKEIDESTIVHSFLEIDDKISKSGQAPLDSYVVDDGYHDYDNDFWTFNAKFPNGFDKIAGLCYNLSSSLGAWISPRGGYGPKTQSFAQKIEKTGNGAYNKQSGDICVASDKYVDKFASYVCDMTDKYDINYWKFDGFLLKACNSEKHGHICGGFNDMYEYTECWERWLGIFSKLRLQREKKSGKVWINQTSYANPSPVFLKWTDSIWMQNSDDMGKIYTTARKKELLASDADAMMTYRDSKYYDFCIRRQYQFPLRYLYNHDPIYGNMANISMTDEEFRKYLFMAAVRGNGFWELYYSYNKMNDSKWKINADFMRFVKKNFHILKNAVYIGGDPAKGEVYGYSSWTKDEGIVALRNPSNESQKYQLSLDKSISCMEVNEDMRRETILPYSPMQDDNKYSFGDSFNINMEAGAIIILKFSSIKEDCPKPIYARFVSENSAAIFFDDRVRINLDNIVTDNNIESINISDDYSAVTIGLSKEDKILGIILPVYNGFGDRAKYQIKCRYYKDNISKRKVFPHGRDFSIYMTIKDFGPIMKSAYLDFEIDGNGIKGNFFGETFSINANISAGDKIITVCEPNAVLKFYLNSSLIGSRFNEEYFNELSNKKFEISENADDFYLVTRALRYDEV